MNELLNQTAPCKACDGNGKILVSPAKQEAGEIVDEVTEDCKACNGSGVVLDSAVPDILKKYGMDRAKMAQASVELYEHFSAKLQESYERGVKDGKAEK